MESYSDQKLGPLHLQDKKKELSVNTTFYGIRKKFL